MICPKCKNNIPEKSVKCSYCDAKIATFCKRCHAYNLISNLNCTNCNNPLLKVCPHCKSVNLPSAKICRKCSSSFVQVEIQTQPKEQITDVPIKQESSLEATDVLEELASPLSDSIYAEETFASNQTTQQTDYVPNEEAPVLQEQEKKEETTFIPSFTPEELCSQAKAKEILVAGISSNEKKIISLSGAKGIGKSIVLKSAINDLREHELTWLVGECTAITQLSPCGLIQDILLTFFNIANFCSDSLKLKKDSQRFFQTEFPTLTNDEIFNLLNLLYPTNMDYYENILQNKEKTFTFLKKVFKTVIENNQTIFVIENFDLIDGFSYEFLHTLLNSDFTSTRPFKILLTYNEPRPSRGYLFNNDLKNNAYLDVSLGTFDNAQMEAFIDQYFTEEKCPAFIKEKLSGFSAGNPAVLEQFVSLLIDYKSRNNSFNINFPSGFDGVMKMRLDYLKETLDAYKVLSIAAIQGMKFHGAMINQIVRVDEEVFGGILDYLQRLNYIAQVSEFTYTFKNSSLWTSILDIVKQDADFKYYNESLFAIYANYTLSSNSIMAVVAQNINQDLSAFNIWTQNTKLSAYIGDTNLYAISQKQSLVLIRKIEHPQGAMIESNIYERLGKLLTNLNPQEAIEYLPNAIANVKKLEDPLKEIELTGYLAGCCMKLGDYHGVIECVNAVIGKVDVSFELEIAMLKSRKLEAILNIGNSGEIINIADNEILPVFDKYINAKPHPNIPIKSLYKAWLQTYLNLANALVFQGNNRSFEVISIMFEIFQKNRFDDYLFICKTKLALAFANTIKGDVEASEEILEEVLRTYKTDIMDNEAISRWNLINILNSFVQKKYSGLQEELFQVVSFANNVNDNFTKNILKTLLGKLFKDEENARHAIEIYSEQITYFAKEKNAIGALLVWYLMSEANLAVEGPKKALEVAQKALDVAQSPKINNYLFIVLFNKVIAEAFMVEADYELAKVHIEKAIMVAKKFELLNLLADLYLLYGKYLQDIALVDSQTRLDYVSGSSKMYEKAIAIAREIKNGFLINKIEDAQNVLKSFCQLHGIVLDEK